MVIHSLGDGGENQREIKKEKWEKKRESSYNKWQKIFGYLRKGGEKIGEKGSKKRLIGYYYRKRSRERKGGKMDERKKGKRKEEVHKRETKKYNHILQIFLQLNFCKRIIYIYSGIQSNFKLNVASYLNQRYMIKFA